jgi:hypothetical protein
VGLDDAVRLQAVVRLEPPDRIIETKRRGTPVTGLRRQGIAQRHERPFDRAQVLGSALPTGLGRRQSERVIELMDSSRIKIFLLLDQNMNTPIVKAKFSTLIEDNHITGHNR